MGGNPNSNTAHRYWNVQIYPYVKSTQVYECPSDTGAPGYSSTKPWVSYTYNQNIPLFSPRLSAFTAPAKTVLTFEGNGVTADPSNINTPRYNQGAGSSNCYLGDTGHYFATGYIDNCYWSDNANDSNRATKDGRHLEGSNFLMADGHVKWFKARAVSGSNNQGQTNEFTGDCASGTSTSAQVNNGVACAEGTEYSGPGAHAVTFSTK